MICPPIPSVHPPVHVSVQPFTHPFPPNPQQQSLRQKKSRIHCLLVLGFQAPPLILLHLPSFPASSSSWCLSTCGFALIPGPVHSCIRSRYPALPGLGAAEGLMWHFPGWPEPGGQHHGGNGGLSGVWTGWGGCLRGSPVTHGPEVLSVEDDGGGRQRWRGLRSPQYTHP